MEKVPLHVISLDSEDDDLEIVSENIINYGNCRTPVEVAPELQEKMRLSLEKLSSIPGKIKAIKVYAIRKNKNEKSTIRVSFNSANGKLNQVVNVGSVFDSIFNNQAKVVTNNKIGNQRKPVQSQASYSDTTKTAKQLSQPEDIVPIVKQDERPLTPPSPVILYSSIKKGKQCTIRNEGLHNVMSSNQTAHKNGNSPNWVSPTPLKDNDKFVSSQFFQCSRQERNQAISEIEMDVSESISGSQKITHGVENDYIENLYGNVCGMTNPVDLSAIKFSSDEEDEFKFDNSILDICRSPKSSFEECLQTFPKSSLEEESSIEKVDEFYSIDDMLNDMELDDSSRDLVREQERKDKFEKNYNDDHENSNIQLEHENMFIDIEPELPKQNVEQCKQFSKFPSVEPVKRLPKRMLKISKKVSKNSEKDARITPQWTNIFPPSPPSLPPPGWISSDNLWQLDATEFMEVTGLCGMERAVEVRRQVNAPKPRVLRKRR